MRPALRALLFALLVATAGCSGGFSGDGGPATGPPSDDPAADDATTDDPATTDGPLAPGLTADGLAVPDALVRAHADALEDRSATLRETRVRRYANGSLRWRTNLTLRTAPNRTRYHRVHDVTGKHVYGATDGRVAFFADGERVYRKVETPNTSWTNLLRTAGGDPENPRSVALEVARTDDLYVLLNAFALNDSAAVRRAADDPRRYRLSSSDLARPELLASHLELSEVRYATLTAVVTSEGLVAEYRLEYEGVQNGGVVRGTRTLRYSAVGETSVEAPRWYSEAKASAG